MADEAGLPTFSTAEGSDGARGTGQGGKGVSEAVVALLTSMDRVEADGKSPLPAHNLPRLNCLSSHKKSPLSCTLFHLHFV